MTSEELKNLIEEQHVTLRKIAQVAGANYLRVLRVSKSGIPGEVYDPKRVNYDGLIRSFNEEEMQVLDETDWEAVIADSKPKFTIIKDTTAYEVGQWITLRNKPNPFEIVWKTETHIVILELGSTSPICWSWQTFFAKGPGEAEVAQDEA